MEGAKKLYAHWELRSLILLSTMFQILLFVRACKSRRGLFHPIKRIFWFAVYLSGDFFATHSLGTIFHVYIQPHARGGEHNKYVSAFWAPFILLHLARHGNIVAFYLKDNEFWPRQALTFVLNESMALYIFIQAFSNFRQIRPSVLFLFIIGTSKFLERIWSIRLGSMNWLSTKLGKPEPGLDIHVVAREHRQRERQGDPMSPPPPNIRISISDVQNIVAKQQVYSKNGHVISLCAAYYSFKKFQGLYADVNLTSILRNTAENPLDDINISELFKSIENEVGFAHDLFYSKNTVTHTIWGWLVRFLSLFLISLGFGFFAHVDRHKFSPIDVYLTFILLTVAILLELLSLLEATLSNWTVVHVAFYKGNFWRLLEDGILLLDRKTRPIREIISPVPSLKVGQHSILSFCSNECHPQWVRSLLDLFELKVFWDNFQNINYVPFDVTLRDKILLQVFTRVQDEWRDLTAANYNLALQSNNVENQIGGVIQNITRNLQFGEVIIAWHLATDVCYATNDNPPTELKYAKFISQYMLYLLVEHPSMLPSGVNMENRYRDACEAVRQFISGLDTSEDPKEPYVYLENICNELDDAAWRREERNSLLLDGFEIACELKLMAQKENNNELEEESRTWNLLFQVWVNLLSYAARNCKGEYHAEQLSTGGELLTYVWLFLLHCFKA